MQVTLFKDLKKSKDVPHYYNIEKIVERIKNGTSKELIQQIKAEKDKDKQNELKALLPCILFAGQFLERRDSALIKHSGLCVLDFDKITEDKFEDIYLKLKTNPHVILLFKSPRGLGLKAVIRIPECDKKTHPRYFKGFQFKYQYEFFDESNSNISRVCYESYDPDIYYNPDAVIFTDIAPDSGFSVGEKIPVLPVTEEDKIIKNLLKWWDKKFGFVEGQRNDNLFKLACQFCEYGISLDTAIGYTWNNIVIGDFPEGETENVVRSAYKRALPNTKYFEDYEKQSAIKRDIKTPKEDLIKKYGITEEVYQEIKEDAEHDDFWYLSDDKKPKLKIDSLKFKFFLERNGFKKHFPEGADKPNFLFIESNKVIDTSPEKIKDFVLNYLLQRNEREVWNFCSTYSTLFTESYLSMIDTIDLMMLKDAVYTSFIAFRNGILKVTRNEIKLVDYIDIDGYIWKHQIVDRDFTYRQDYQNDYQKFISNVSDGEPLPLETVIGYLLSNYKNKTNNKAIILNDQVITPHPEGGTGKGLFVQGIKAIRKVSILDGKSFDDKKSFPYQTVQQDTQVLVFDDVVKKFNFENKFSLVTEGLTLERKNKDAIKLSVETSPKIVISTNYVIEGQGNSHDRRRIEVEFSQHYGKRRTPFDDFGRHLFDDWNQDDYERFDNYMVYCLQTYLNNGIITQTAKNLTLRKLIAETKEEFVEWIDSEENFPLNTRNQKTPYFDKFVEEFKDYKNVRRSTFQGWIKKYADFKGYEFSEGVTQGSRWFMLQTSKDSPINEGTSDVPF